MIGVRIDLEWAKQKIHGFEKYMAEAQAAKKSEKESRERCGVAKQT